MSKNISREIAKKYISNLNSDELSSFKNNMREILSKKVSFQLGGKECNKKNHLYELLFSMKKNLVSPKIKTNNNLVSINFKNISHSLHLDSNYKISKIIQSPNQSGGGGFTYAVNLNPVGGQPIINGYLSCCRPIFYGNLLKGGQKGGRLNTAYYLDIEGDHLNVLPQYRQYKDTC